MIVIPKYCYFYKLNMKQLLSKIRLNLLILRENSLKTVALPDFNKMFNRKLNEEVSWSFMVPTKSTVPIESVLAGNPQPFNCDKVRYDVPKNWSLITNRNNNSPTKKP